MEKEQRSYLAGNFAIWASAKPYGAMLDRKVFECFEDEFHKKLVSGGLFRKWENVNDRDLEDYSRDFPILIKEGCLLAQDCLKETSDLILGPGELFEKPARLEIIHNPTSAGIGLEGHKYETEFPSLTLKAKEWEEATRYKYPQPILICLPLYETTVKKHEISGKGYLASYGPQDIGRQMDELIIIPKSAAYAGRLSGTEISPEELEEQIVACMEKLINFRLGRYYAQANICGEKPGVDPAAVGFYQTPGLS